LIGRVPSDVEMAAPGIPAGIVSMNGS
jgi:hypothetical protein